MSSTRRPSRLPRPTEADGRRAARLRSCSACSAARTWTRSAARSASPPPSCPLGATASSLAARQRCAAAPSCARSLRRARRPRARRAEANSPFCVAEVEAVSQTSSPSAARPYGLAFSCRVLEIPRSTVYATRARQLTPTPPRKRGPKTAWSDAELTEHIREAIRTSPWLGEGTARSGPGCARRACAPARPGCCD